MVKGTCIPVAVILDQIAAGESWESLLAGYPGFAREKYSGSDSFCQSLGGTRGNHSGDGGMILSPRETLGSDERRLTRSTVWNR